MKKALSVTLAICIMMLCGSVGFAYDTPQGTVLLTDYVAANSGTDSADAIQAVIDANPNRTIYIPDGEFLVSHPIYTPADPSKSVSLQMTDFAVLKAMGEWPAGEAVVQLGGKLPANTTAYAGSNYSLDGGVIDGSGMADGVSINSGRETMIRNTSIKNTKVGVHVFYGANSGSSDADLSGLNIIGTNTVDSIGIWLEGYDNTVTNVRIGGVYTGVWIQSCGNSLKNIHPLCYSWGDLYEGTTGFVIDGGDNFMDYCYSDQFATGFRFMTSSRNVLHDCFCYWYALMGTQTAYEAVHKFNSDLTNCRIGFREDAYATVLKVRNMAGKGSISDLSVSNVRAGDFVYRAYLTPQNVFQMVMRHFYRFFVLLPND